MIKKKKTALITGITGQDGSYLAEFLLRKNYKVVGMVRLTSKPHLDNIVNIKYQLELTYGDLLDGVSLTRILRDYKPDEIYNLGAQSIPRESFRQPVYTAEVTGLGLVRLLEAMTEIVPKAKVYSASSSEVFGEVKEGGDVFRNEESPLLANNPYAIARLYGHLMARYYRDRGFFVVNGILFNHESPRRGQHFVTRKIATGVACIKLGVRNPPLNEEGQPLVKDRKLSLGNLEVKRDWGFAGDYIEAMWLMLQQPKPDDFVIGTGELHTIVDFCQEAFSHVGLDWKKHVIVDERFLRPTEIGSMAADFSKAKRVLGWEPRVSFKELVKMMVEAELARFK